MIVIYPSANDSIIDAYVKDCGGINVSQYCYDVTMKNSIVTNYKIIADYIDKGDYIEPDILSDNIRSKGRISQITFILLKRYMKNYYEID
jgi:hypothetical protein